MPKCTSYTLLFPLVKWWVLLLLSDIESSLSNQMSHSSCNNCGWISKNYEKNSTQKCFDYREPATSTFTTYYMFLPLDFVRAGLHSFLQRNRLIPWTYIFKRRGRRRRRRCWTIIFIGHFHHTINVEITVAIFRYIWPPWDLFYGSCIYIHVCIIFII